MTNRPVKLKLLPRSVMKVKSATRLTGRIVAGDGIAIVEAGGVSTISAVDSGENTVVGPVLSTDNAIARWDGTLGDTLQNSGILIGDTNIVTGGTWDGKVTGINSVLDFGADPTGIFSASSAFAAAYAFGNEIYVPPGTYKLSSNQTWPVNKKWHIVGTLSIDTGVTITNNGVVESGFNQIFSGLGTIVGMRFNRPEWWGATNAGTPGLHNDATAINAAIASAQASSASTGDRPCVRLAGGAGYYVTARIVLSPTVSCPLEFGGDGNGLGATAKIIAATGFSPNSVILVDGQSDSIAAIMNFWIHDFTISAESVLNKQGMAFGSTGKNIGGYGLSLIENVHIDSLAIGFECDSNASVRLIALRRCNVWLPDVVGGTGLHINPAAGGIVGDWVIQSLQVVCSSNVSITGQKGIYLRAAGGTSGGITGLHFHDCTTFLASKAVFFETADNQTIGDIWFYSLQAEGGGVANGIDGIVMSATGGAVTRPQIYDVHFIAPWLNSLAGKSFTAVAGVQGTIQQINQTGGFTTNSTSTPLELNNVLGGSFVGFTLRASTGGQTELIKISGATASVVISGFNVNLSGTTLPPHIVTIAGTADNNTITGAAAAGQFGTAFVNVTSSGTNNSVIYLPGTVSSTGTGAIVRAVAPTISGNLSLTGQFNQNVSVHANALQTLSENAVDYGFFGAANNVITGASATDLGIYAPNGINLGASGNVSRMKITSGGVTLGTATAKGVDTFNTAAAGLFQGAIGVISTVKVQVKTAAGGASQTYTPSAGMLHIIVRCVGGGGGGGGTATAAAATCCWAGGGGAGGYSEKFLSAATVGASQSVSFPAGSAGGLAGNNTGTAGGDVSFGTLCIAKGGAGGVGNNGAGGPLGGVGGVAGTGDIAGTGESGASGTATGNIFLPFGHGGSSSPFGGGGRDLSPVANAATAGDPATGYGGGGGGANSHNAGGTAAGGAGSTGIVVITEFCTQ